MPEFDEFGIPIKKTTPEVEVDEFGIPFKKNESPNQKTVSVGSKPLPQDGGLSPFISKPKEEKLNVGKSFTNVGRSQMGDQELPEPPRPEDPTKQLLAQQWAKKPMSKEIVEMGKTQSAMGAKPLSEKEYDTQYTEARFTLDKLPSRVKAVINENNRDEILDYLKNNPYELQRMQKWIENPKEAGLQSQEVVLNTLRGAIQSTVQKDADAIGELDRLYGTGAKISRLTALASDIDKTADELKKYQTQVEFYQNKFLENKGNAQLVNQIKAEKAAINKFDYKGFKSELDAIQKELAPMQEYLSGIEAQYPNGIPRDMYAEYQNAYTKYQSAALRYNELLNTPEYQQYQKSVDNYNNLVNQQKQLVSDFQGDSNYKKALQGYEKAREKYDLLRTEYEDIPKFDVKQYFGHAKRLSDAQGVLSSIEPAFPMAVEREKIQEKIKAFGELNPNVALTQRALAAWETIPEAVEKVAGGALNLLSTTGKALAGYNEKDLYTLTDKYADYLNDFGKLNNTLTYEGGITNKSGDINWKSLPVEALRQIGNLAVFATVGKFTGGTGAAGMLGSTASTSAPMVSTAYFMSRMDRAKEAEQAGLQGAQKEMYVSTLSLLEGLSELIMPDAQLLTKPVKNKLLKDAVQGVSKGKNWYTKQALLTIAENSGKEAAEELVVKLGELLEKTAVNYAEGNVFNTEEYKNINDWAATALVAAPLAGVSTSISQINQPTEQMEADMYRASSDLTASRSVLDAMVEKGKITAQQADKVYKNIVRFAAVRDIIPQDISPEKAVQLVPLIEQNETIKMLLQDADDIFKPRLQKALKENIEKAQEILNSKEQIANEPITRDEIRGADAVEESVGEQLRISETGVEETVTEEVSPEVVMTQMKPITDEMVRVEMEFSNNGYKIDWDYDNEITVTDKRGELVEPEDLPENLLELAGQYEKATAALGNFDYNSYFKALQQSRQDIGGIETEFEEVKPLKLVAPVTPEQGEEVQLEPRIKGGQPRIMVYDGGVWKEKVGNTLSEVSSKQQQEAQEKYANEKPSPTQMDVGEQARDGEEMGERNPQEEITQEGEEEVAVEPSAIEKGQVSGEVTTEPDALKDFESTAKALEGVDLSSIPKPSSKLPTLEKVMQDGNVINLGGGTTIAVKRIKEGLSNKVILQFSDGRVSIVPLKSDGSIDPQIADELDYLRYASQKEPLINSPKSISEAYHKAKADGSNPELVKAVEELLSPESQATPLQTEVESKAITELEPEIKSNLEKIQEETGTNFREIQNVYNKYGEGKPLNEITVEDYRRAEAKRQAEKEPTEKQIADTAQKAGITPKNLRDLYKINRELFGLDRIKSLASAIAMDRMVGAMAKRANITKAEMYGRLKFEKDTEANVLKADNALFQGTVDGKPVTLRNMDVDVVNGFYSPIEKNVKEYGKDKIKAKDWLNVVGKGDEAVFTGVRSFLEGKDPNAMVSKQEILDYMKDNRISVVEVVKEETPSVKDSDLRVRFDGNGFTIDVNKKGFSGVYIGLDELDVDYNGENYEEVETAAIQEGLSQIRGGKQGDDTKFSPYQLEGEKENYKEIMVILPRTGSMAKVGDYKVPSAHQYGEDLSDNRRLVHLRMNTRTDADGNKVLFLEEVQSDWGQTGKKEGFFEKPKIFEEKDVKSIKKDGLLWLIDFGAEYEEVGLRVSNFPTKESAIQEAVKKLNNQEDTLRGNIGGAFQVPTAPFVMDTNAWVKLGLKIALKEAVAQGADKIAWTTGEQQNERYDLSKQVNKIDVEAVEEADGVYFVDIELSSGTTENLEVENGVIREGNYKGQKLEDVIGKEYADKVLSTPKGESVTLQGEDLKLGGKGMKGFYGSIKEGTKGIVGGVAEKLFGQKVGETKIKTSENIEQQKLGFAFVDGKFSAVDNNGKVLFSSNNRKEVLDYIKGENLSTQPSVDITPALRAEVERGLALFQRQQGQQAKGAMVAADGAFVIYALTDPNVSTPLHEMAHVFEHYMTDAEKAIVQSWAGTKGWTTQTSEKFARGFEKYLAEGKAPTSGLQKIFDKFKTWLTDIYNGITGSDIDIELNEPMREIYAQMLGAEAVKPAKAKTAPKSAPKVVTSETIKEVVPEKTIEAVKALTRAKKAMTESARTKVEETAKDAPNFDKAKYIMDNLENIKAKLLESGKLTTDCKWG